MTAVEKAPQQKREPYVIKVDPRPERYARGWYVIGDTSSVSHKPRELKVFGTRLVAYRGKEDNDVHILDAYCPHMGGDLCGGEIKRFPSRNRCGGQQGDGGGVHREEHRVFPPGCRHLE